MIYSPGTSLHYGLLFVPGKALTSFTSVSQPITIMFILNVFNL